MALQVTTLKRVFKLKKGNKDITIADIAGLAPEEVQKHYVADHPELTNATILGPKVNKSGEAEYTFSTEVGRHG